MNEMLKEDRILRNLKDAGCDAATIQKFLQLQKGGKQQEAFQLLSLHRTSLLDQVHISQHMIDCLDYLIYAMEKNKISGLYDEK